MTTSSLLSEREKEVVELLLFGKSNKQIATTLNITVHTVEFHLGNIYKKIGVVSRSEAILALAKIQLGETIGEEGKGELGESLVEIGHKAVDNAKYPIERRVPMKRIFFSALRCWHPLWWCSWSWEEMQLSFDQTTTLPGKSSSKRMSGQASVPKAEP